MKMPQCDVCCMTVADGTRPKIDVTRDLNIILGPDYVCNSIVLCTECTELTTRAAKFIQKARVVCSQYILFHKEGKEEHLDGVDILFEDECVQQNSDEEKLFEKARLNRENVNTKVKPRRKNNSDNSEKDKLNDFLKPKKDGRRIIETQEYSVIWLSKEQVRAEIEERLKSENYLNAPFRCPDCARIFNYEDVFNIHRERHSPKNGSFKCDICQQFCPSAVSLRGHMKSHSSRYKCKVCGCVKGSRQHLLEHHRLNHAAAGPTEAPAYTCAQCGYSCQRRTMFHKHLRSHTARATPCHQCGKMFKTTATLRVHMLSHTSSTKRPQKKPVKSLKELYCVECDIRFSTPSSLANHLKRSRPHRPSQSITHSCDACKKTFSSEETLRSHMAWAHEGRREHACAVCSRAYGTRDGLRAHARRAHGPPAPKERRHRCGYCDRMFTTRAVLAKHERIHTGERPYECQECGQTFSQTSTRTTHIRLVHRKLPRKSHILGL